MIKALNKTMNNPLPNQQWFRGLPRFSIHRHPGRRCPRNAEYSLPHSNMEASCGLTATEVVLVMLGTIVVLLVWIMPAIALHEQLKEMFHAMHAHLEHLEEKVGKDDD